MRTAAPKDRQYLETLNLKALQKVRKPAEGQPAREFYEALQREAKEGPLFDGDVLRTIEHLPELPKVVTKWLGNLKDFKDVDARDLNLIIDWVNGDRTAPQELSRLTWKQAVEAQQYWHEHEFKVEDHGEYKTHDVVFSTGGYDFVEITDPEDLATEGRLMGHCVGRPEYADAVESGESRIYSLRDSSNRPHVTIEVDTYDKSVRQCYGKQNSKPTQRYNAALVKFFERMNLMDGILHLSEADVPESLWAALARKSGFRIDVAKHRSTPGSVLRTLATGPDNSYIIRRAVAANPNTPADVLRELAKDSNEDVRWYVLRNPNTPSDVLRAAFYPQSRL